MVTISGKKAHAILNSLLSMLSSFLNYSESGGEIKTVSLPLPKLL